MRGFVMSLLLVAVLPITEASAEEQHVVRSGQSLSRLARRYRVSVHDLAAANSLRVTSELQEGQVLRIPERGFHYVRRGDSLASIARAHSTSVTQLKRLNRLRSDTVQLGQRLTLPGHDRPDVREAAQERWGRPRHPGVVSLLRMLNHERLRLRVLDGRGRPRRGATNRLAHLFRYRGSNQQHQPHPRLLKLLTQVSDHFGGRLISVLSAYRPPGRGTNNSSRHVEGAALDIRIQGVPNDALVEYLRRFDRVGVGLYPNARFVHFDVRDRKAYWVDRSNRGDAPEYDRAAARAAPAPAD